MPILPPPWASVAAIPPGKVSFAHSFIHAARAMHMLGAGDEGRGVRRTLGVMWSL